VTPFVSVLVDTYNHEKFIEQALVSVIEQDFPRSEVEIVVVDDGSADRTPEIVRKFTPHVRLLRKNNGGQASAFNLGVRALRGEIVMFLDGDDWFARRKVATVAAAMRYWADMAAVGHGYFRVNEVRGGSEVMVPEKAGRVELSTPEMSCEVLKAWPYLVTSALSVRMSLLRQIMPLPKSLRFCADTPIAMAAMARGVRLLSEPLCYYRNHESNLDLIAEADAAKANRRDGMHFRMYVAAERNLLRLGAGRDSVAALIYPELVRLGRAMVSERRAGRMVNYKTEMCAFELEHRDPSPAYRFFKRFGVGAALMLLPPTAFFTAKHWYARKQLGRVREKLIRSR
jgi:hypothetical protein